MLILSRRPGERILIGDNIVITFVEHREGQSVALGITAPDDVEILREELLGKLKGKPLVRRERRVQ